MGARAGHVPRRRCVGCGRVAPKPELLRLAAVRIAPTERPVVTVDPTNTIPGRGAYVCARVDRAPEHHCLKLASGRGILQRAFRGAVQLPAELQRVGVPAEPLKSENR